MQFQTIITSLALAIAVTAAPNPPKKTNQQCQAGQVAACCNTVAGLPLLNILGGSCTAIVGDILASSCSQQQTVLCCQSDASQTGLINVNAACVQPVVPINL